MALSFSLPAFVLALFLLANQGSSSTLIVEDGYTVSTVLDGNKLPNHHQLWPFSILPWPAREDQLLLLDSHYSSFYSLSFPLSQNAPLDHFAGSGKAGFSDGQSSVAMFNHPRSFAVDARGNVYVADRTNNAIRKITQSGGVTTIAGGYLNKTGHVDGPAQNASFSNDFDLTFIPKRCVLLISDRGNRLVRQMVLKPVDCIHDSQQGLGVPLVSVIGVLCSLAGLIVGWSTASCLCLIRIWKFFQTSVASRVLITFSGIRSEVASLRPHVLFSLFIKMSLSVLSLIVSFCRVKWHRLCVKSVSLLDLDPVGSPVETKRQLLYEGESSSLTREPLYVGNQRDDSLKME